MNYHHWFIIYISLLMLIPSLIFFQTGKIFGKYSLKNSKNLLNKTKSNIKNNLNIKTSDDVKKNQNFIINKFSHEKYKVFLLSIRNFGIGFAGGYSISPFSLLNDKSSDKKKNIEKYTKYVVSVSIIGLFPLLYLISSIRNEKGIVSFIQSNYFGELFEVIIGVVSGYLLSHFADESKNKNKKYYKIKMDKNVSYLISILCAITFLIMFFMYVKPS